MAWWSADAYKHKNAENRYVHHWVFSPQNKGWFCSVHNWCNPFSEPEPCHDICVLFCVVRTFAIKLTWQALLSRCYTFSPTDLDLNSPNLLWGKHGHCFERIDSCKAALIPTRNQLPVSPYCTTHTCSQFDRRSLPLIHETYTFNGSYLSIYHFLIICKHLRIHIYSSGCFK